MKCGDSSNVECSLFQESDGGSQPTSPLQYKIMLMSRQAIDPIIEQFHYSHSSFGVNGSFNLGLANKTHVVGAAIIGQPATYNLVAKYNDGGRLNVAELRRFCLRDDAPKNSESYFLSKIVWFLRKNSKIDLIISFADETYGHKGTIYQAANWRKLGDSLAKNKIEWNGKMYHQRALHQKNFPRQVATIKAAIESGEARIVKTGIKHVYGYRIMRVAQ